MQVAIYLAFSIPVKTLMYGLFHTSSLSSLWLERESMKSRPPSVENVST